MYTLLLSLLITVLIPRNTTMQLKYFLNIVLIYSYNVWSCTQNFGMHNLCFSLLNTHTHTHLGVVWSVGFFEKLNSFDPFASPTIYSTSKLRQWDHSSFYTKQLAQEGSSSAKNIHSFPSCLSELLSPMEAVVDTCFVFCFGKFLPTDKSLRHSRVVHLKTHP